MQNSLLKFRQSFIIFEKYGYLTGKLKILTAPSKYLEGNIFCWNLHIFPIYQCLQKDAEDIFILFRSWVIDKPSFWERVETTSFFILANNLRSRRNETNLEHPSEHIGK